jgi:uncharacterized damage-inducible protein DinB
MDVRDAIRLNIDMSAMVCEAYLEDLSDEDLLRRPHPDCNHLKWQVGHLVASEHQMISELAPGTVPPLPQGFADRYSQESAASDDPAQFDSKDELLDVYREQRAAVLQALAAQSDEDLERPAPEAMRSYAPTVAAVFSLIGSHWMMHAGQWAVLRRELGRKPIF